MSGAPPIPRYRLTVVIDGNTMDEVEHELACTANSFDILRRHPATGEDRDSFDIYSGRSSRSLEHRNPDMTPERYRAELDAWAQARREVSP